MSQASAPPTAPRPAQPAQQKRWAAKPSSSEGAAGSVQRSMSRSALQDMSLNDMFLGLWSPGRRSRA